MLEASELKRGAELMRQSSAGVMQVGLGSGPGALLMTPLMCHMAQNHPKVKVQITRGATELQLVQLRARIAHTFPTHQFWGEESDAGEPTRLDPDRYTWLIDPIDGSMNFLRGYPQYAVSIALLQGSEPIVGCVMDPVRGECFDAALGLGAQVNGTPLRVAHTAQLAQAVAATVFPKPTAAWMDLYLAELGACLRGCAGARRAGSMALELAYLAAGRVDVFWARGMGAWDAAAGRLLIQEAGGAFWTLDGEPWWRSRAVAASAPGVETLWQNLLQDAAQTLK